jgi:hypothetical protein
VTILKLLVTMSVVIGLAFVTERAGPRWAGVLSGFPTGSAITLYFFAAEHGLEFAGSSAVYNIVGLVAMQTCALCFASAGTSVRRFKLFFSIVGGVLGYVVAVAILRQFSFKVWTAVLLSIASFVVFGYISRTLRTDPVVVRAKFSTPALCFRSSAAALLVVVITWAAGLAGGKWAGLFSAFPVTLFPLLVILHHDYGQAISNGVVKHVPEGLGSLLVYSLVISRTYPRCSLYVGMAFAFLGAFAYLCLYYVLTGWWTSRRLAGHAA